MSDKTNNRFGGDGGLRKGIFITMEGVEGSGKTTQIERLKSHLESRGFKVEVTREPGGTPIAEAIRGILLDPKNTAMAPLAELLLYESARAQHVAERIRPALEQGRAVICDRFFDSTTAYQGAGRNLPREDLENLHMLATGGLVPDLTIVIDVPVLDGLARAARDHERDRIELESVAFHERVRAGFLELAERYPGRIKVVDGRGSREQVAEEIAALADAAFEAPTP